MLANVGAAMKVETTACALATIVSLSLSSCADRRVDLEGGQGGPGSGASTAGTDGDAEATSEASTSDAISNTCGDGVVGPGEACDDGNEVDGDGCNRDCIVSGSIVWTTMLDGRECYGLPVVDSAGILYARLEDEMGADVLHTFESRDGSTRSIDPISRRLRPVGGNRFASGVTLVGNRPTLDDWIFVQRHDAAGNPTWEKTLEDPTVEFRRVTATAVGADGSVTMAMEVGLDSGRRYDLLHLDGAGSTRWSNVIEEMTDTTPREYRRGATALDGDVVFINHERIDRYHSDGTLRWSQPLPDEGPIQVAVGPDGTVHATLDLPLPSLTIGVRSYDADGSMIADWIDEDDYELSTRESHSQIDTDSQGNVVVGHTAIFHIGLGEPSYMWVRVSKHRPDGAQMWSRTFEAPEGSEGADLCEVVVTPDDGIVVMYKIRDEPALFMHGLTP